MEGPRAQAPNTPMGINSAHSGNALHLQTCQHNQPQYPPSVGTALFAKLTRLILDVCPDVMRDILRHCLGSDDECLCKVLDENRNELEKIGLYKDEYKRLFVRQTGISLYSCLDYSLMYKVARNIPKCNKQIKPNEEQRTKWGQEPRGDDRTLLASIERLRLARNTFIAHVPSTEITEHTFREEWDKVREPIMDIERHLGWGTRYTQAINTLRDQPIDPETIRLSGELLQKEKQIQDMKEEGGNVLEDIEKILNECLELRRTLKSIFEVAAGDDQTFKPVSSPVKAPNVWTAEYLKLRRQKDQFFYETRGYHATKERLTQNKLVIVSGKPGIGKTGVAIHLLFDFMKRDYIPRILNKPKDWERYVIPGMKQIVVVDDIFGSSATDRKKTSEWINVLPFIHEIITKSESDILFVMTVRSYILRSIPQYNKCQYLSKKLEIDLSSKFSLNLEEKRGILDVTICRFREQKEETFRISEKEQNDIVQCEPPHGFPLCVKLYIFNDRYKRMGTQFLKKPLDFVYRDMSSLINDDINRLYLLLIILLQEDEEISLDDIPRCKELLKNQGLANISSKIAKLDLLNMAYELKDLYLIQTSTKSFRFRHESIEDTVGILFAKQNFKEAVGMMKLDTLLDRVRIGDENMEVLETASIYAIEKWDLKEIARRLQIELTKRNVQLVSTYEEWKYGSLVSVFIGHMESIPDTDLDPVLEDDKTKGKNLLYWSATQGQNILCKALINYLKGHVTLTQDHLKFILSVTLIGACSHVTIVPDVTDLELVAYLVELQADVSFCQACFLEKIGNNMDSLPHYMASITTEHLSPLEEASRQNMGDVVRYLLSENARIDHIQWNGWALLHCAAKAQDQQLCNADFIQALIEYDSKMKNENESAHILFPTHKNINYAIINISFSCCAEMSVEEKNALFLTFIENIPVKRELVSGFLSFGAEISCRNELKRSALHVAIRSNLPEIEIWSTIKVLLDSGCDPNILDKDGISPLMLCVRMLRDVSIVKELLKNKADPDLVDNKGLSALHYCVISSELDNIKAEQLVKLLLGYNSEKTGKGMCNELLIDSVKMAINFGLNRLHIISQILRLTPHACQTNLIHYVVNSKHEQSTIQKLIDVLLQSGISINSKDGRGLTPLMHAVTLSPPTHQLLLHLLKHDALRHFDDKDKKTVIHHCVSSDHSDVEVVEIIKILEKGKGRLRLNSKDKNGLTPLMACAIVKTERGKTIEKLLSLHASAHDKDCNGQTVVHHLVISEKSDLEVVATMAILKRYNADLNVLDNQRKTPLMKTFSSERERYKTIRYLAHNVHDLHHLDSHGRTCLHTCVMSSLSDGQTKELCKIIIEKGVNIDTIDRVGNHAFDLAIRHSEPRIETLKILIRKSQIVQTRPPRDIINELIRHEKLYYEIIDIFRESKTFEPHFVAEINVFHDIVHLNEPPAQFEKIVKSLKMSGFDVDAVDKMANSALLQACKRNSSIDFVKCLLQNGANPKLRNGYGKTALHLCILSERSDVDVCSVIDLLLEKGADVNSTDRLGIIPLAEAIRVSSERFQTIRKLLDSGARVDTSDKNGRTAIHHCVSADRYDEDAYIILDMILKHTNNCLDMCDSAGCTALNLASTITKYSRVICMLRLLEAGCCNETVDSFSRSPVYNVIYCLDGHEILIGLERVIRVALLLAYKCDPVTIADDNTTPITIAIRKNYEDLQKLLAESRSQRAMLPVIKSAIIRVAQHYEPDSVSMIEVESTKLIGDFKLTLENVSSYLRRAVFSELDHSYIGEWEASSDFVES